MIFSESLKQFLSIYSKEICAAAVASIVFIIVLKRRRKHKKVYPKDTVVHHQSPRGPHAPNLSPFPIKLETYLRMAKIPYINEFDSIRNRSSKGKATWIEYNGEEVADSEFCIKYLNKKFNTDLDKGFSDEEKAVVHSMQKMIEENTYWTIVQMRWVFDPYDRIPKVLELPRLIVPIVKRMMMKQAYAQGMGRHTKSEVLEIMMEDLNALSKFLDHTRVWSGMHDTILDWGSQHTLIFSGCLPNSGVNIAIKVSGSKKFLLGDIPCKADCGIFGMISQFYWHSYDEDSERTIKKFPNLCNYCERMKSTFWPDWDECNTHGGTRPATK